MKEHMPAKSQSSSTWPLGRSLLPVRSQLQPKEAEGMGRSPKVPIAETSHSFANLALTPIQAKLTIGAPNDRYEQEADRVAAQVMSTPDSAVQQSVQRESLPEEEETMQMKSAGDAVQSGSQPSLEDRLSNSKGGGNPLSQDVRAFMEPRFEADFSGVRVHTGEESVQMNRGVGAQAFAHGQDIYFGAGKSPGNDELMAHELTHVVQQNSSGNILQRTRRTRSYHATDREFGHRIAGDTENMGDVTFEILAHDIAYRADTAETRQLIQAEGFRFENFISNEETGLQFYCLSPSPEMEARGHHPVLAFRGSEGNNEDWFSDLADYEPGTSQFHPAMLMINNAIQNLLSGGNCSSVDVTGHSLGGALAQITAAVFPQSVRRVVTFQAPGIGQDLANRVRDHNRQVDSGEGGERIESSHYRAAHDIVDNAGEVHTEGDTFEINFDRQRNLVGGGAGVPPEGARPGFGQQLITVTGEVSHTEGARAGFAHMSQQLPTILGGRSHEELNQIEITQGTTAGESITTRPIEQLRRLLSGDTAVARGLSMPEAINQWIEQHPEMLSSPHLIRSHRALLIEVLIGLASHRNFMNAMLVIDTAPEADRAILLRNYLVPIIHGLINDIVTGIDIPVLINGVQRLINEAELDVQELSRMAVILSQAVLTLAAETRAELVELVSEAERLALEAERLLVADVVAANRIALRIRSMLVSGVDRLALEAGRLLVTGVMAANQIELRIQQVARILVRNSRQDL